MICLFIVPPAAEKSCSPCNFVCCLFLVDLLGLLKWRSNTSLLQQNLRQLMKVEGGEVVKVRKGSNAVVQSVIVASKAFIFVYASAWLANINVNTVFCLPDCCRFFAVIWQSIPCLIKQVVSFIQVSAVHSTTHSVPKGRGRPAVRLQGRGALSAQCAGDE